MPSVKDGNPNFPGNLSKPFSELSDFIKPEFGTVHFHRLVQVYFKYKCPHSHRLTWSKCCNCVETNTIQELIQSQLNNLFRKDKDYSFSIIRLMESECHNIDPASILSKINQVITSVASDFLF